jgi:acyl-coenzyme A synthetase/AMP-(fatty) acid ligase
LPPPPEVVEPDAQPVRWLFYTAGTTADPKGVRHVDAGVIAAARAIVTRSCSRSRTSAARCGSSPG